MPDFHGFGQISAIPNKRTTLDTLSYEKKMCLSEGDLRPVYLEEVLPSDIISLKDSFVIKNIPSPFRPVIDDAYFDISYFFVPRRLLWQHWEAFIGADAAPDAYTNPTVYEEPVMSIAGNVGGSAILKVDSIINDLGIPYFYDAGTATLEVSPFPLAAFSKIWNEFYRDENLQDENPFDSVVYALASGATLTLDTTNHGWALNNVQVAYNSVNKYHDLFTSCLPMPQKGGAITLPLGTLAPVKGLMSNGSFTNNVLAGAFVTNGSAYDTDDPIAFGTGPGNTISNGASTTAWYSPAGGTFNAGGSIRVYTDGALGGASLVTDLSNATAATINSLRLAFAAQAYLEALARGGSRYTELLTQMFGVSPNDARLQRPEFLGTIHHRISQTAVASSNGKDQTTISSGDPRPTGALGAYTVSGDSKNVFVKQCPEHGYIIGVASIRVQHTYGEGVPKIFLKKERFDYFNKYFDRIGNVPVSKKEIHVKGTGTFGFQEAWYENKFHANEVSGSIGPDGTTDLQTYTYCDDYGATPPTLSSQWIKEDRTNIDQTLIGFSGVPQFVIDIFHSVKATRPFSVNSVPAGIGF